MNKTLLLLTISTIAAANTQAGTIDTFAGAGGEKNNGDTGPAAEVNIAQTFGVEVGPGGAIYVTEVGHHRIWRIDPQTKKSKVIAGTGERGYTGDGGPATAAKLNEPYEVRFDAEGNMYFVEMRNHVIRRVDAKTGVITTVAGTGQAGFSGDGGPAAVAALKVPHSIALDGRGGLYVADIGNHRIRRIDLKQGTIETIAGNGQKQMPRDGSTARGKAVIGPRALFIEGRTLWIALREGHSVWRLNLDTGRLKHIAGTGKRGYSGDGRPALQATFNGPKGIAVGPQGNVYVVDTENQVIRKIDMQSGLISTVAGRGPKFRGFAGDGGPANAASLDRPHGICVDAGGRIYIGDTNNHRVRVVTP